jgi:PAS domain S-box-containing protein
MNILLLLPPFFYALTALFWIFLIIISFKKYRIYYSTQPLFSKFSVIITFFSSTAAITSILLTYQHLHIDHPDMMLWVDWAILALNTSAAIVTSILFTHHTITDSMENIVNKIDTLKVMNDEKNGFNDILDEKEDFIFLQETLLNIQEIMISATEPNAMLDKICLQFCAHPSFSVSWIGFANYGATELPISFFHDRAEPRFLSNDFVSVLNPDDPYSNGPSSQALLTAKPIVIEDTQSDLRFSQWHSRAKFSQIISVLAFPMIAKEGDRPIGVLTLYSQNSYTLEDPGVELLRNMTLAITKQIGVLNHKIQIEKQAQKSMHNLYILEQIIDAAPIDIFWKDKDLRYAGANTTFLKNKHVASLHNIVGKNDSQLGWYSEKPDIGIAEGKVLLENREIHNQLVQLDNRWLITSKTRYYNKKNLLLGLVGMHIDVTSQYNRQADLKRNEQYYHDILDNIPELVLQYFDKDRYLNKWNAHNTLLFGYSEEEAIGKKVEELLLPEESRNTFINKIDTWLTQNRPIQPSIIELVHKDKTRIKIHVSYVLVDRLSKNPTFIAIYLKI